MMKVLVMQYPAGNVKYCHQHSPTVVQTRSCFPTVDKDVRFSEIVTPEHQTSGPLTMRLAHGE